MSGACGPRLGKHRAPVSFTADELVAAAGFRTAMRLLRLATANEQRATNENRSATDQRMARARTEACVDAYDRALETLVAAMEEV